MLGAGHSHSDRVRALLVAAREALADQAVQQFGAQQIGLSVTIFSPDGEVPGDATNYLGGIGDVLEDKSRRGALDHLGDLAGTSLFENDRQIREVAYRIERSQETQYEVRIWSLEGP